MKNLALLLLAGAALAQTPEFTAENYPRTDGSTSAHPLGVLVASALVGVPCRWRESPSMSGTERRLLLAEDQAWVPEHNLHRRTWHDGTHGSWVNLIEGDSDLIYVCRYPSPDELELMAQKGVKVEAVPIARDAFVFLLNRENPVDGLTLAQIRDIYTNKVPTWKAVGGPQEHITAYQRNRNSGSQETMETLVMPGLEMPPGRSAVGLSMTGPYNLLVGDKWGIAYTFYYYHEKMSPVPELKLAAVDGVKPDPTTIVTGRYPLVTPVLAVIRADTPADAPVRRLQQWLLTPAGQAVVGASGYVPLGDWSPEE